MVSNRISGRKKLTLNGNVIDEKKIFNGCYTHNIAWSTHTIACVQIGDDFDIRVDGESFAHKWQQHKVKQAFVFEG